MPEEEIFALRYIKPDGDTGRAKLVISGSEFPNDDLVYDLPIIEAALREGIAFLQEMLKGREQRRSFGTALQAIDITSLVGSLFGDKVKEEVRN